MSVPGPGPVVALPAAQQPLPDPGAAPGPPPPPGGAPRGDVEEEVFEEEPWVLAPLQGQVRRPTSTDNYNVINIES
jgi:hypothetical protein